MNLSELIMKILDILRAMLQDTSNVTSRWLSAKENRSTEMTYFSGTGNPNNPSNNTSNMESMVFKKGGVVYRTIYYKWDDVDQLIEQRNYPF